RAGKEQQLRERAAGGDLRAGHGCDDVRAGGEVRGAPAVEPGGPRRRTRWGRKGRPRPLSQAIAAAAGGETRPASAVAKASPSSGATAGAASAFAGTVSSGTAWDCSHRIGAVAIPHAVETAITPASFAASG